MAKNDLPEDLRAEVLRQRPDLADALKPKKKGRYGNVAKRVKTEEGVFDSRGEYRRWCELKLRQAAGEIRNLRRQVDFEFFSHWTGTYLTYDSGRKVIYRADFTYEEKRSGKNARGEQVQWWSTEVEDYKGKRTEIYKLKKALMDFINNIKIRETGAGK